MHAAGLADADGTLLVVREDVGRHNAVDKVVGCAGARPATPPAAACLVLSGRVGFELVQKAAASGIGVDRRRRRADQPRGAAGRGGRDRPLGLHLARSYGAATA